MVPTSITPPTDNLYKFVAISGLVLTVLGVALMVQSRVMIDGAEDEVGARLATTELFGRQLNRVTEDTDRLSARLDSFFSGGPLARAIDEGALRPRTVVEAEDLIAEGDRLSALNDSLEAALEQRTAFNEVENARLLREARDARALAYIGGVLVVIGLGVTVLGFSLWWSRVQQYEDAVIRAAAVEAQRRL